MKYRKEYDTMGEVAVPADKLWGAQTQRSLQNFHIGIEKIPLSLIHGYARLKKSCARVNATLGLLEQDKEEPIVQVCDEILAGMHDDHFPLSVWQTGSGTQTNMNLNEVIANRAVQLSQEHRSVPVAVHPNDHVNMSQSSNDTFPSAMHIAAVFALEDELLPALRTFAATLEERQQEYQSVIKIGRTHLQDATPLTLGQEISGWKAMVLSSTRQIEQAIDGLRHLAIGGTAVGTGINAPDDFGPQVTQQLTRDCGKRFLPAENTFHGLTSHDQIVYASGALKGLAANMMKIANDVRWLASGPRCGLGELILPANEPGSSIMPGKVNPTQAEALTMVACQVFGNDATIGFAASQGNFELNVFKPVIIYNFLQSVTLLSDAIHSFETNCVAGIQVNKEQMDHYLHNSLMLVTALNPVIGYDNAAKVAKKAHQENISLRQAATSLGFLSESEFDKVVDPTKMTGNKKGHNSHQ